MVSVSDPEQSRLPVGDVDDGLPLDASSYGDDDERPADVGPACDGCGRDEAVTEAGTLDLCGDCADAVADDLGVDGDREIMELFDGVERAAIHVDGEQRHEFYREGGDGVQVVVEWPGGGSA